MRRRRWIAALTVSGGLVAGGLSAWADDGGQEVALSPELAAPVRLEAGGQPIDTEVGHAHPLVADWDGDGTQDLLVGQFGGGILWIFRNEGTTAQPKLAAGVKFKDGADDGRVPTG